MNTHNSVNRTVIMTLTELHHDSHVNHQRDQKIVISVSLFVCVFIIRDHTLAL